ncbi:MAG: hypothetical protein AAF799_10305 [Myxococcota bacterium]
MLLCRALVLSWSVPGGCPERAEFEQRLSALLGGAPVVTSVDVEATIIARGGGFDAVVRLRDEQQTQTRQLSAHGCERLTDAIALLVAVRIDVVRVAAVIERSNEAPEPPSTPRRPDPAGAGVGSTPRIRGFVAVGSALGFGVPRGLDGRVAFAGGRPWPRARVEARLEYGVPRRVSYAADGVEARFQRVGGTVFVCRSHRRTRWAVHGCGGVSARALQGRGGTGVREPGRMRRGTRQRGHADLRAGLSRLPQLVERRLECPLPATGNATPACEERHCVLECDATGRAPTT